MCGFGIWDSIFWPFGFIFNIIFWVLVICGIAYLINNSSKPSRIEPKKEDPAMEILRKRYAAGEINSEEFLQKKKDLNV